MNTWSGAVYVLRWRCERAVKMLEELANDAEGSEATRLHGKADGVRLALSYLEEEARLVQNETNFLSEDSAEYIALDGYGHPVRGRDS